MYFRNRALTLRELVVKHQNLKSTAAPKYGKFVKVLTKTTIYGGTTFQKTLPVDNYFNLRNSGRLKTAQRFFKVRYLKEFKIFRRA
jgi:hypothetical protein